MDNNCKNKIRILSLVIVFQQATAAAAAIDAE